MASQVKKLPKLIIPTGQTLSNILVAWRHYGDSAGIVLYSKSDIPASATIQVCYGPKSVADGGDGETIDANSDWFDLQDGETPADVVIPGAGKAQFYDRLVLVNAFRLKIAEAEQSDLVVYASSMWTD